ncbi:hypothetical protein llg_35950 [Luteolibacter sp. LG18]|nr:hypothetical protein llg_35950 [Luteolibacter sp. LG18]
MALCLTGCFDVETSIHLKKDGSGAVVREIYFDEGIEVTLDPPPEKRRKITIGGPEGNPDLGTLPREFYAEFERKVAATMGKGVTFGGYEKLKKGNRNGCRITYHFEDINTLEIEPEDPFAPGLDEPDREPKGKGLAKPITFTYRDGTLTIHSPKNDPAEIEKLVTQKKEGKEDAAEPTTPSRDMLKQEQFAEAWRTNAAKDRKGLKVVLEDGIASTDAAFVQENVITLLEIDHGRFSADPAKTKKVEDEEGTLYMNLSAAAEKLKGIDGVKIEPKGEIRVTVK